jgi:2-polyprenyl-3-methyl-5-hydroxy-6-metoxy-1,4-benzoquinol methylase
MFFVNRSKVIARYAKGKVLDVGFGGGILSYPM